MHVDDMTLEQRVEYRANQLDELVIQSVSDPDGVFERVVGACDEARTEWLFAALDLLGECLTERQEGEGGS